MPVVYSSYVVKVSVLNKGEAVSSHESVRLRSSKYWQPGTYIENIKKFKAINVLKLVIARVRRAGLKNLMTLPDIDIVGSALVTEGEGSPTIS
jgi:hypothetical protein